MPRSVTTMLAAAVGLLAASSLWLTPSSATAQPAPTSTTSSPTTTTTPLGPLVPPTTAASRSGVPVPPLPTPGLFDVAGRIRAAVNSWLRDLVASAIDPAVDLAARSVLATPNLAAPGGRVRELWGLSVGHCCIPGDASKQPDCRYETLPHSPTSSSAICLCRLPLPVRRHRARRALVPALRPVLPRCRGAARRAWCRGRPCHDLPVGPAVHAAADRGCSPLPARRRRPLAGGRDLCEGRRSVAVHLPCDRSVRAGR
jgi:hypothetical protein